MSSSSAISAVDSVNVIDSKKRKRADGSGAGAIFVEDEVHVFQRITHTMTTEFQSRKESRTLVNLESRPKLDDPYSNMVSRVKSSHHLGSLIN